MDHSQLSGIIAATVTPLSSSGSLDEQSLKRSIQYVLEAGVHGLFICGSTGEGVILGTGERVTVAEMVMKQALEVAPVIVQIGGMSMKDVLYLAQHAESIGAAGVAVVPPFYFSADETMLVDYFSTVAATVPTTPVYLYNIPQNAKNSVTPNVAKKLQDLHGNISGVKESSGNFGTFGQFIQECLGLSIFIGNDADVLPALVMGAAGAVSASSCVFPTPFLELYKCYVRSDLNGAREWQAVCTRLKNLLTIPFPVSPHKKALELLRVIESGSVRRPLRELTSSETDRLTEGLKELKVLVK